MLMPLGYRSMLALLFVRLLKHLPQALAKPVGHFTRLGSR